MRTINGSDRPSGANAVEHQVLQRDGSTGLLLQEQDQLHDRQAVDDAFPDQVGVRVELGYRRRLALCRHIELAQEP